MRARRRANANCTTNPIQRNSRRNLVDLLETLAFHHVNEDNGCPVVTLFVPFHSSRIGYTLERHLTDGGHDIGTGWELPLVPRRSLDSGLQRACRVVGAGCVVFDGPVLGAIASCEAGRPRHFADGRRSRQDADTFPRQRRSLRWLDEAVNAPAAVPTGKQLIETEGPH